MNTITVKDGTTIYFKDWGKGQPIVFSHGWPLTADAWDAQMLFFGQHGYRVIAHDRRGHGRSSQPWDGNDMDIYADDLAAIFDEARSEECHAWLGILPAAAKWLGTWDATGRNALPKLC